MSTIWVIEPSYSVEESVASTLMGDFAVRVFASAASFRRLHRTGLLRLPDVILVKTLADVSAQNELEGLLSSNYCDVPRILLIDNVLEAYNLKARVWVYPRKFEPIALSQFIRHLIKPDVSGLAKSLRFKDLAFDVEQFSLTIEPQCEVQAIPPKEARILRILMKSAGKPISRQDISEALWDGMKVSARSLDSHISRLRRRIEGSESTIESIYGGGYILK